MEKILTFSIAAYNVEKYLDKLLKTIICVPNHEMVEVLVVNDGSKDSTAQIAKEYEKKLCWSCASDRQREWWSWIHY